MRKLEEGLIALTEALSAAEKTKARWREAELHRLKGELLLKQGADEFEAELCFYQALEITRRQGAKSWELRAMVSLGRPWQKQGKQAKARKLLEEIYGWFTEGSDTADLKEAKVLLDKLS